MFQNVSVTLGDFYQSGFDDPEIPFAKSTAPLKCVFVLNMGGSLFNFLFTTLFAIELYGLLIKI